MVIEPQREVFSRINVAVAELGQSQSLSVGDQLGEFIGGCLPEPLLDLGRSFDRRRTGVFRISHGTPTRTGISRTLYRALSIDLLFAEHSSSGGSRRTVFRWNAIPAD